MPAGTHDQPSAETLLDPAGRSVTPPLDYDYLEKNTLIVGRCCNCFVFFQMVGLVLSEGVAL